MAAATALIPQAKKGKGKKQSDEAKKREEVKINAAEAMGQTRLGATRRRVK